MTNGEKFKAVFGFGADGSRVIAVNSAWWDCEFQIRKPMTNADRIRAMSVEKMAEWLGKVTAGGYGMCAPGHYDCTGKDSCAPCWLDWLKQGAKDEEIQP